MPFVEWILPSPDPEAHQESHYKESDRNDEQIAICVSAIRVALRNSRNQIVSYRLEKSTRTRRRRHLVKDANDTFEKAKVFPLAPDPKERCDDTYERHQKCRQIRPTERALYLPMISSDGLRWSLRAKPPTRHANRDALIRRGYVTLIDPRS